uniref:XS domain-containing protein n=1 Tax=Cajanus cajan TaxID=3821 RepID=A0A151TR92_CAJCA|nr:hypothetical protein KK1_008697 [Cajanus cajan]
MSSKRGGGRPVTSANNDMCKGKSISEYQPKLEQLTQGIADTKLNSGQDDGEWEVYARKPKNKAGSSAGKPWGGPSQNSNPRAWSNADMAPKPGNRSHGGVGRSTGNPWQTQNANFRRPAGRGNGRPQVATSGYESYTCQGGPGAIDWYRGLQPLMTHAKTKGSKRVKIHRELAILLDEELHRRGTSVIPAGEIFGKWKGLKEEEKDHEIVWPPMVIIQNTKLEQDDNDKWIGMGNQELLDYFSTYAAVKARHAYGPQGHRGMSVLIFEASASGYLEAERLHKHFAEQGTDRDSWFIRPILYLPGGNRQLYGYMATKEDLDFFNKHAQGKSRLKYDLRSYQEMVVHQIRQMNEDNQQLIYFKNKAVKGAKHTKALEESIGMMSEKLRKTMEENRIVRRRTKMQHEETKEEMYMQEKFFKDQMKIIHESRDASEEDFERKQQEEREKVKQSSTTGPVNSEEYRLKVDEYLKFVEVQDKEMENFVAEKDKLCYAHDASIAAMRRRHWEEEMQLEQKFDEELANLMEKYSPS